MRGIVRLAEVCRLEPCIEPPPVRAIAILCHAPVFDDVDFFEVHVVMVFKIALIGRFLQGIDAPILSIDEHDGLPYSQRLDIQFGGHGLCKVFLSTRLQPVAASEWMEVQVLETGDGRRLEKPMFETLFAIFLASIKTHSLLLVPSRSPTMGAKSAWLVDATVVGLIKL